MTAQRSSIGQGALSMAFDAGKGGRIISFQWKGYEFLTDAGVHPDNYGSTFWPSPQSAWNWPPPPVIDTGPYTVEEGVYSAKLLGGHDPMSGLQCVKELTASGEAWLTVRYSLINRGSGTKRAAPWEITRVRKGGLFFFPLGEPPLRKKHFAPVRADLIDGIVWVKDSRERPAENLLSIADGAEGWVAYAIDGRVLIKKYADSPPEDQAPGEAEVLLYMSSEADYLEIELQGRYDTIGPGEHSQGDVEWTAAAIPPDMPVESGNGSLVRLVRRIAESSAGALRGGDRNTGYRRI